MNQPDRIRTLADEIERQAAEYAAVIVDHANAPLIAAALRLAEAVVTIDECCGTISESGCSRNTSAETDLQTLIPAFKAARGAR